MAVVVNLLHIKDHYLVGIRVTDHHLMTFSLSDAKKTQIFYNNVALESVKWDQMRPYFKSYIIVKHLHYLIKKFIQLENKEES